ncbi:hypothetical protein LCGC14_2659810 [marine sediment metagenome]|uniref:Uncharacterized protein n=1 Tax=marine sediment metagenome TaxID=412755 RepID=A0A0F8ZSD2_9ZZZZ
MGFDESTGPPVGSCWKWSLIDNDDLFRVIEVDRTNPREPVVLLGQKGAGLLRQRLNRGSIPSAVGYVPDPGFFDSFRPADAPQGGCAT